MIVTIESTSKRVFLNGVESRIWEGETESGIKVHCFITLISVSNDEENIEQFENELLQLKTPTAEVQAYPLRLLI